MFWRNRKIRSLSAQLAEAERAVAFGAGYIYGQNAIMRRVNLMPSPIKDAWRAEAENAAKYGFAEALKP